MTENNRQAFEIEFGQAVERERARLGWTAAEAAERAGIAGKTWQRLEDGKPVRAKSLIAVDHVFGLPRGTTIRVWHDAGDLNGLRAQAPRRASADGSTTLRSLIAVAVAAGRMRDLAETR